MSENGMSKALRARELGVSRGSLYYQSKQPDKDWKLKCRIEEVLRRKPSYGHRRIAGDLKMNKKPVLRVMNLFGIKPYLGIRFHSPCLEKAGDLCCHGDGHFYQKNRWFVDLHHSLRSIGAVSFPVGYTSSLPTDDFPFRQR